MYCVGITPRTSLLRYIFLQKCIEYLLPQYVMIIADKVKRKDARYDNETIPAECLYAEVGC